MEDTNKKKEWDWTNIYNKEWDNQESPPSSPINSSSSSSASLSDAKDYLLTHQHDHNYEKKFFDLDIKKKLKYCNNKKELGNKYYMEGSYRQAIVYYEEIISLYEYIIPIHSKREKKIKKLSSSLSGKTSIDSSINYPSLSASFSQSLDSSCITPIPSYSSLSSCASGTPSDLAVSISSDIIESSFDPSPLLPPPSRTPLQPTTSSQEEDILTNWDIELIRLKCLSNISICYYNINSLRLSEESCTQALQTINSLENIYVINYDEFMSENDREKNEKEESKKDKDENEDEEDKQLKKYYEKLFHLKKKILYRRGLVYKKLDEFM